MGQVGGAGQGAEVYLKQGHGGNFQTLVEISPMQRETREHNFQPSFVVFPIYRAHLAKTGQSVRRGFLILVLSELCRGRDTATLTAYWAHWSGCQEGIF